MVEQTEIQISPDTRIAATALLVQMFGETEGALDITHAQGFLGEELVAQALDDQERVAPLLALWRTAQVTKGPAEKEAASSPDWLILDDQGQITALVEVKAVRSNKAEIDDQKRAFKQAWYEMEELLTGVNQQAWEERLTSAWNTNGHEFVRQIGQHFDRLRELVQAGLLQVVENPQAILYVPNGEDYSDIPSYIRIRDHQDRVITIPLELRRLPSLQELKAMVAEAQRQAFLERPETAEIVKQQTVSRPDGVVRARIERMRELLPPLQQILQAPTLPEQEGHLARLIMGERAIQNNLRPGFTIAAAQPETILRALGSTHPNLIAHFLFEAAGGKVSGASTAERESFMRLMRDRSLDLDKETATLFLGTLIKLRGRIAVKGYSLPSLEETIASLPPPSTPDLPPSSAPELIG